MSGDEKEHAEMLTDFRLQQRTCTSVRLHLTYVMKQEEFMLQMPEFVMQANNKLIVTKHDGVKLLHAAGDNRYMSRF